MNSKLKLLLSIGIPVLVWALPSSVIPIRELTIVEHRLIVIFVFALVSWVLEPIPVFSTAVLIIVLELCLISDHSFAPFARTGDTTQFGILLSYKAIMATFASPIIMLFLGGFFIAMAATKFQLDVNLTRVLLKPFGSRPDFVLLGLMLITAVFSMFMSNTATTAMMLALLTPVINTLDPGDKGKMAFVLGIPFAANVGGIGTPIGTPPNVIAVKYLTGASAVSFGEWMSFGVPFAIIMMVFVWILLLAFFKPQTKAIQVQIKGKFRKNWQALTVYITCAVTLFFWLFDTWHGMTSYQVAMIPVAVFTATGIINVQDVRRLSWEVLWLVSGGIALGLALDETGLAKHIIDSIPFASFPAITIVWLTTVIAILMSTFMSHTATANLMMPIMAALGAALPALESIGGSKALILGVAISCSLAMALPISTPPNAMAHATGEVETRHMLRTGLIIGLVGLLAVHGLLILLNNIGVL